MRASLLPLLLLAGCATGPSRQAVLNGLVGQPETELVRQLGVPSRSYETAGRKFLAFVEQRTDIVPSPGFYAGGFGIWGNSFGGFAALPPTVFEQVCETTFEVAGGRVLSWSLRGNAC